MKCPGEDPQNLKTDDIFEIPCPECGADVEFWKGDHTATCPRCRAKVDNPHHQDQ